MKTVSKIAIFSTLLAGTLSVGAHPHSRQQNGGQQQGRQGPPREFQDGQQRGGQHRYAQSRNQQGRRGPDRQFHAGQQGGNRQQYAQSRNPCTDCQQRDSAAQHPRGRKGEGHQQFRGQRGTESRNPERPGNQRRQARLERFDTDKDGRLSAEERQAMPERTRGNPGSAPRQPAPAPVNE